MSSDLTVGDLLTWAGYPDDHVAVTCDGRHDGACMFCDGGLFACAVCGGLEGSVPTQCPGAQMSDNLIDNVYRGHTDYRNGHWVDAPSMNCPAGAYQIGALYEQWLREHQQVPIPPEATP